MSSILKVIVSMVIWGSLGIFVKLISLPSFEVAFLRALIAAIFLGIIWLFKGNKKITSSSNRSLFLLILSGAAIGFNWVFLFQAYKYTSIANATLSYYFAPVIVVFISPFIFKEKFTLNTIISVVLAMFGLFMILNRQPSGEISSSHLMGIIFALLAAVLYASVILINKQIQDFGGYERTFIQLCTSALVLLPFIIYRNKLFIPDEKSFILVLILGIIHTGVAYLLYFSAIRDLKAQSAAMLGYIDPVSAILFSMIFLGEPISIYQAIGGALILASTFISEICHCKDITH